MSQQQKRSRRRASQIARPPLGQRIFEKRTELGFSQEYVAEMIGAPQSWTTKLERGEIRFGNPERMRALARLLNLDYDELLLLSGLMDRYATAQAFAAQLPPEGQAQLAAIHERLDPHLIRIDGDDIETLVRMADTLARAADTRRGASSPPRSPSAPSGEASGARPDATSPSDAGCGR